jgi:2-phosphosulfolactate phosphatase
MLTDTLASTRMWTMSVAFCEWGEQGARTFEGSVGALIIVDVLSFSTCVDIAVARRALVYPFAYGDPGGSTGRTGYRRRGRGATRQQRAPLQPVPRLAARHRAGEQARAAECEWLGHFHGVKVDTGSHGLFAKRPRRCRKVCRDCTGYPGCGRPGREALARRQPAAGDRGPDGCGRDPRCAGPALLSEAEVALHAFRNARPRLAELVRGSVSGQELVTRGYPEDVETAIQLNVSDAAPLLVDGAYSG